MPSLEEKLVEHLDDAHAMEQSVLRMLDGLIRSTEDAVMRGIYEQHKTETERHRDRVQECLRAHGEEPSKTKELGGMLGALVKMPIDMARSEHAAKNARDAYATEHVEIASYELLERLARKAGDARTAQVATENLLDEQAMAQRITAEWDHVLDVALAEEHVEVAGAPR
jgi:ferritin-like metal-binding protein YciE